MAHSRFANGHVSVVADDRLFVSRVAGNLSLPVPERVPDEVLVFLHCRNVHAEREMTIPGGEVPGVFAGPYGVPETAGVFLGRSWVPSGPSRDMARPTGLRYRTSSSSRVSLSVSGNQPLDARLMPGLKASLERAQPVPGPHDHRDQRVFSFTVHRKRAHDLDGWRETDHGLHVADHCPVLYPCPCNPWFSYLFGCFKTRRRSSVGHRPRGRTRETPYPAGQRASTCPGSRW